MTKYKVLSYNKLTREHRILNVETSTTYVVDLFVVDSFKPELIKPDMDISQIREVENNIVGKGIEIESLEPITYFARNCTIKN